MRRIAVILASLVFACGLVDTEAAGPAAKVGDHHEVRVVAVRTAMAWTMFPGMPGGPSVTPGPGEVLVIVEFAARDLTTSKDDGDASFSGFEVENAAGQKTSSPVGKTDLREIPFSVSDPASVRFFGIGGARIDVSAMTKGLKKP